MATLKLPKPATRRASTRPPVRGAAPRPTLSQAQAERAQRPAPGGPNARRDRADDPGRAEPRPDERRRPAPSGDPRRAGPVDPRRAGPGEPRRAPPADPRRGASGDARRGPPADSRRGPPQDPRRGPSAGPLRAAPRGPDVAPARPASPPPAHADGSLRLSKRMSELGLASRREADEWIAKGWVRVDGEVVAELGARVMPDQRITVDSKARHEQAQRVTVLLNKPVGYVSGQAEDGYEPAIVLVQAKSQWREDSSGIRFLPMHLKHLAPAGRLDIDSVGLLVLTQDGRIAKQLIGEDGQIEKEYLVRVEPLVAGQALSAENLALLNHGLSLDDEPLKPARVEWVNEDQLRFVLTEGKKRQVRRMCELVGLKVTGLKRVRIGRVMLGDLPSGQWRYLRPDESFA
jgi:23S rRNA pseudouridine2604 synthase